MKDSGKFLLAVIMVITLMGVVIAVFTEGAFQSNDVNSHSKLDTVKVNSIYVNKIHKNVIVVDKIFPEMVACYTKAEYDRAIDSYIYIAIEEIRKDYAYAGGIASFKAHRDSLKVVGSAWEILGFPRFLYLREIRESGYVMQSLKYEKIFIQKGQFDKIAVKYLPEYCKY